MRDAIYQLEIAEVDLSAIYDPHPDAPLTLEHAVCLPEMGGLGFEPGLWTVKRLRGAITTASCGRCVLEETCL